MKSRIWGHLRQEFIENFTFVFHFLEVFKSLKVLKMSHTPPKKALQSKALSESIRNRSRSRIPPDRPKGESIVARIHKPLRVPPPPTPSEPPLPLNISPTVAPLYEGGLIRGYRNMDSVSAIAIYNTKPPQVDINDPEQRKLIENLNQSEAKIWQYSDNKPSFLAKLHKNNPSVHMKVIESIVNKAEPSKSGGTTSFSPPSSSVVKKPPQKSRDKLKVVFNRDKDGHVEVPYEGYLEDAGSGEYSGRASLDETTKAEVKMVIKKTLELIDDMHKSIEFVFHATRATARFMTYPTPSIPSDNYIFGHAKGWMWLLYKALATHNTSTLTDEEFRDLGPLYDKLRDEMSNLLNQALDMGEAFEAFNNELRRLHTSVKKEASIFFKSQGTLWGMKIEAYLRYCEELKMKRDALVNIKEDRPFASDWVFHPHPSKAAISTDFLHFQWLKPTRSTTSYLSNEFEVRSDYSTRWHAYSSFPVEKQLELISILIAHLHAMYEETTNFIRIHMRLTFDYDEIKCLRFAIGEINSPKKTSRKSMEVISDVTRRLFQDMALLEEVSQEFMDQLDLLIEMIEPSYHAFRKEVLRVHPKVKVEPLIYADEHHESSDKYPRFGASSTLVCFPCFSCFAQSLPEFLEVYGHGEVMRGIFLRTPVTEDAVFHFFDRESIVEDHVTMVTYCNNITPYGVSEGYISSIFDAELGRDPPTKKPKRLPKLRRRKLSETPLGHSTQGDGQDPQGQDSGSTFNLTLLLDLSSKVVRKATLDGEPTLDDAVELDMEIYLQLFDEIRKFFHPYGSKFNFIMAELTEGIEKLENRLYTQLSDNYESLEKMIDHEKAMGIFDRDPLTCGTKAFRRVHTAFLFFTLLLENLVALDDQEVTAPAVRQAYYKSYAKYHSWFIQKTSMFSVYNLPTKVAMYGKIGGVNSKDKEDNTKVKVEEIDKKFQQFVHLGKGIYDHCENVFREKDVQML